MKKSRHRFTEEQKGWLEEYYYGLTTKELTDKFNECFYTDLTTKQIEKFKDRNNLKSGLKSTYTKAQKEWLKQNVINGTNKQLVAEFNKKFKTNYSSRRICQQCGRMGLVKRKVYEIGDEVERKDGYIYVKVSPKKWVTKQRYIYEKHYGKIPKNYVVAFLDKNPKNYEINNLYIAPKAIVGTAVALGLTSRDKELNKTGLLLAELMIEIKKRKK